MTYMVTRSPAKAAVTCSPGGCRSCLLYHICSCRRFYTCALDNQLRHCHSKKAPTWNKRFKAPRRIVRQLSTNVFLWLSFSFPVLCVHLSAFPWGPRGCAVTHITAREMRGSGAGGARTGGDPRGYRQPHCFCCRATWDDLIQLQHVQYTLSAFSSMLYLGPGSQRREMSFDKQ